MHDIAAGKQSSTTTSIGDNGDSIGLVAIPGGGKDRITAESDALLVTSNPEDDGE